MRSPARRSPAAELRRTLLAALGAWGDPATLAEARVRFDRVVANPGSLPPEIFALVTGIVGTNADAATFDRLHALAQNAKDPTTASRYRFALMRARDPQLAERALQIAISNEVPPQQESSRLSLRCGGIRVEPQARVAVLPSAQRSAHAPLLAVREDPHPGAVGAGDLLGRRVAGPDRELAQGEPAPERRRPTSRRGWTAPAATARSASGCAARFGASSPPAVRRRGSARNGGSGQRTYVRYSRHATPNRPFRLRRQPYAPGRRPRRRHLRPGVPRPRAGRRARSRAERRHALARRLAHDVRQARAGAARNREPRREDGRSRGRRRSRWCARWRSATPARRSTTASSTAIATATTPSHGTATATARVTHGWSSPRSRSARRARSSSGPRKTAACATTRSRVDVAHGDLIVMAGDTQLYWEHRVPRDPASPANAST